MKKQIRIKVYNMFNGKCAYTGKTLPDNWQVDHKVSRYEWSYKNNNEDVNNISNLFPALQIVNHYKRSKNIEQFRDYMMTFHIRLSKLPKTTSLHKTKNRILYMQRIADAFDITVDKPFSGVFYFEKL